MDKSTRSRKRKVTAFDLLYRNKKQKNHNLSFLTTNSADRKSKYSYKRVDRHVPRTKENSHPRLVENDINQKKRVCAEPALRLDKTSQPKKRKLKNNDSFVYENHKEAEAEAEAETRFSTTNAEKTNQILDKAPLDKTYQSNISLVPGWDTILQRMCKDQKDATSKKQASFGVQPLWKHFCNGQLTEEDGICPGDLRLRKIMKMLDSFRDEQGRLIKRSREQRKFHKKAIDACLMKIYGLKDFYRHKDRILRERGIDGNVKLEVLCITPRRFGKTWAVAMHAAAMLMCVPGFRLICFATNRRTSGEILAKVVGFIMSIPGGKERIAKKTEKEELFLVSEAYMRKSGGRGVRSQKDSMETSSLKTFPSSVDGKFLIIQVRI